MPDNDSGISKTAADASSSTTERRVLFDAARGNNEEDGLLEGKKASPLLTANIICLLHTEYNYCKYHQLTANINCLLQTSYNYCKPIISGGNGAEIAALQTGRPLASAEPPESFLSSSSMSGG